MKKYLLLGLVLVLAACQKKPQSSIVYVENGFAINGYDAVAFFDEGKPVKGLAEYSYNWQDATWLFASAAHKEQFMAHPDQFAPQYGGYCAYGCADGHKAPTQVETWSIVDGKLYFNYNLDVKKLWQENQMMLIEKANKNWQEVMYQ